MSEKPFLTPEAVAARLDISLSSIYNAIHDGRLEAVKLGAEKSRRPTYRVSEEALAEFLERSKVQPREEREEVELKHLRR